MYFYYKTQEISSRGDSPLQSLITVTDDGAAGNSHRRNNFQFSYLGASKLCVDQF
ncbi:hypothetical protein [Okeania sp. KiyG1]|uniref:hypothetical protein n=1 Tax=Okeania sp. KiyG1 TaxID=2720165 RepID=UPI001923097D|nr:hypothetical protein [Okeania sp. KiyG1]